jgi:ketosteroid isomerase-like protein
MRSTSAAPLLVLAALCASCRATPGDPAALADQVRVTETAFAQTMADRDHAAFTSFLADEAVFFAGSRVLRGKEAVAADWKKFYDGAAPFSWRPESVEVLGSGTLAYSSGPVFAPTGERVGTFNSIWRRERSGEWKIVFDKGCPPCDCAPTPPPAPPAA